MRKMLKCLLYEPPCKHYTHSQFLWNRLFYQAIPDWTGGNVDGHCRFVYRPDALLVQIQNNEQNSKLTDWVKVLRPNQHKICHHWRLPNITDRTSPTAHRTLLGPLAHHFQTSPTAPRTLLVHCLTTSSTDTTLNARVSMNPTKQVFMGLPRDVLTEL